MVARLKLKEIDGRAPPGVNKNILNCKYCRYMLLKVDRPKLGAGRKRLLVKSSCALQYNDLVVVVMLSDDVWRYHRIAGKS